MDQHDADRPAHVGRESVIPAQRTGPADDPSRTRAQARSFGTRPVTKQHFRPRMPRCAQTLVPSSWARRRRPGGLTQPFLATPANPWPGKLGCAQKPPAPAILFLGPTQGWFAMAFAASQNETGAAPGTAAGPALGMTRSCNASSGTRIRSRTASDASPVRTYLRIPRRPMISR